MRKLIALLLAATVTPCAAQDYGAHHFGSLIIDSPPTFSSLTGLTQCLQVNTSGVVSGTGAACGGGGGYTLPTASISTLGGVKVDTAARTVSLKHKPVELTAREYALVEFMALHRGEVVTRTQLYEHLFDENESSLSNLLDVHVSNVRKKLGAEFIATRRGHGYSIE